jgi:hypothetical protein
MNLIILNSPPSLCDDVKVVEVGFVGSRRFVHDHQRLRARVLVLDNPEFSTRVRGSIGTVGRGGRLQNECEEVREEG